MNMTVLQTSPESYRNRDPQMLSQSFYKWWMLPFLKYDRALPSLEGARTQPVWMGSGANAHWPHTWGGAVGHPHTWKCQYLLSLASSLSEGAPVCNKGGGHKLHLKSMGMSLDHIQENEKEWEKVHKAKGPWLCMLVRGHWKMFYTNLTGVHCI